MNVDRFNYEAYEPCAWLTGLYVWYHRSTVESWNWNWNYWNRRKLAGNVKTLKQHRDFSKSSSQSETLLYHAWSHIMFRIPYYATINILMFSEATTNTSSLVNRNSSIWSVDKVQYTGASVICRSWDMSVKVFQIIVIIDFKYKALQTIDVSNARLC